MKLSNPFQMNDWEIGKCLKAVLAIHIAMCAAICLDVVGLQIPIIRPLIGFIYLTFVPGILILRIIRLHKVSNIETLLYTVGLSLSTLMFTGFFMNMIYPSFGISEPISLTPLMITISAVVLVLCVLCYVRDKDFSDPSFIDIEEVLSPPVLFLCLIPFMAVLGTYLVNFHHNNILLMLMIVVIALVALLIGFDKFIPAKLYPLAIWVIAISLIWHNTLISMYLNIFDVFTEYHTANLIITNRIWDYSISTSTNAMLSIVMLTPTFHHIFNMDLIWVFKIIYPLAFSLVPLGLYSIFQKRAGDKVAFFSCFLFVSINTFYTIISSTTKQSTAEFFFVLLLMLILNTNMNKLKNTFLSIIFVAALITSHYGTSYLVMFSLIFVLFFVYITENKIIRGICKRFYFIICKKELDISDLNTRRRNTSLTGVVLFITFALAWYVYISSSATFDMIVRMGDHIARNYYQNIKR